MFLRTLIIFSFISSSFSLWAIRPHNKHIFMSHKAVAYHTAALRVDLPQCTQLYIRKLLAAALLKKGPFNTDLSEGELIPGKDWITIASAYFFSPDKTQTEIEQSGKFLANVFLFLGQNYELTKSDDKFFDNSHQLIFSKAAKRNLKEKEQKILRNLFSNLNLHMTYVFETKFSSPVYHFRKQLRNDLPSPVREALLKMVAHAAAHESNFDEVLLTSWEKEDLENFSGFFPIRSGNPRSKQKKQK